MGDYEGDYAILSHTWEKDEVTFQEMLRTSNTTDLQDANRIKSKAGFVKIRNAAQMAASMYYDYVWIDTCCIDKSSSAELSEAINSMFRWYKEAGVCMAYLADVCYAGDRPTGRNDDDGIDADLGVKLDELYGSKWFSRGWTLQELIAPVHVRFYSKNWDFLGEKSRISRHLSHITGISQKVLLSPPEALSSICIARRMSWASKRITTRIEDMAYCLLGLFDVNMPLLYGEGEKAFQRLQEEIVKKSDDHSLFAWKHELTQDERDGAFALYRGLFARSPSEFADCSSNRDPMAEGSSTYRFTPPSTITNIGLQTRLQLIPVHMAKSLYTDPPVDTADPENEYLALLDYQEKWPLTPKSRTHRFRRAIHLKKLIAVQPVYLRVRPDITYSVMEPFDDFNISASDLIIQLTPRIYLPHLSSRLAGFYVTLRGPAFHAPFKTIVCVPGSLPGPLPAFRAAAFLPAPEHLRHQVYGTVARMSTNGLPIVIAFGIDSAYAVPITCVYRLKEDLDSTSIPTAETKRMAFAHNQMNFLSLNTLENNTTACIRSEEGVVQFNLTAALRLKDDKLVCDVTVYSNIFQSVK